MASQTEMLENLRNRKKKEIGSTQKSLNPPRERIYFSLSQDGKLESKPSILSTKVRRKQSK